MDTVHNGRGEERESTGPETIQDRDDAEITSTLATVAVVAAGAALFEVALLPGLVLGVAAIAAPKYLPRLAGAVTPIFKSAVRGTYKFAQKSREAFAGVHEHVNDIVAEARTENAVQQLRAPV
jgi:hypothetical protein